MSFFGFAEDPFTPIRLAFPDQKTDASGMAKISQAIDFQSDTNAPLLLKTQITMFEPGGRPISAETESILHHKPFYIGIRPYF